MIEAALKESVTLAFKHLGVKGTYHPKAGDAREIQVLPTLKDQVLGLQGAHLHMTTATFKVLAQDAPKIQAGDQIEVQGRIYEIQGTPLQEMQGEVWQVEAVAIDD